MENKDLNDFIKWAKDHKYDVGAMIKHNKNTIDFFMDIETDNAWLGFKAGRETLKDKYDIQ